MTTSIVEPSSIELGSGVNNIDSSIELLATSAGVEKNKDSNPKGMAHSILRQLVCFDRLTRNISSASSQ